MDLLKVKDFNNFQDVLNVVDNAAALSSASEKTENSEDVSKPVSSDSSDKDQKIASAALTSADRPRHQVAGLDSRQQAALQDSLTRMLATGKPEVVSLKQLLYYLADGDIVSLIVQLLTAEELTALAQRLAVDPLRTDAALFRVHEGEEEQGEKGAETAVTMDVMGMECDSDNVNHDEGEFDSVVITPLEGGDDDYEDVESHSAAAGLLMPGQPVYVKAEMVYNNSDVIGAADVPTYRKRRGGQKRGSRPPKPYQRRSLAPAAPAVSEKVPSLTEPPLDSNSFVKQEGKWIVPQDYEEEEWKPMDLLAPEVSQSSSTGSSTGKKRKKRQRVCAEEDCPFCTAAPCGDCYACCNNNTRQKCRLRRCPRLNQAVRNGPSSSSLDGSEFLFREPTETNGSQEEDLRCTSCGRYYVTIYSLTKHKTKCADINSKSITIKYHRCDACNEKFATPRLLKSHTLLTQHQTDLSNVYCVTCDSRFTTLSGFYGHHKIKHVLVLPDQATAPTTPPSVHVKLESEELADL